VRLSRDTALAGGVPASLRGRIVRIVVAPDKFRGSLTALEAAEAMAAGVRAVHPDAEVVLLPVADGGEGTVDAAVAAGFSLRHATVRGPAGDQVQAAYALHGEAAVLEMAEASGLRRLPSGTTAPLHASTYGTGELLRAALDAGARRIVLGVGGSATTDGGAGMAQALGVRLTDEHGDDLPGGGAALLDLRAVDVRSIDPRVGRTRFTVATDVDNPLVGPEGAAAVYGPQKGADDSDVERLELGLRQYADVIERDLGVAVAEVPGAGAAGGLGAGAMVFLGAEQATGISAVLDIVGFAEAVEAADLVLTGEGSLDSQSLAGKAPVGVAAASRGVPVVALVGRLALSPEQLVAAGFSGARALLELEPDLERAQSGAAGLLARLAEQAVRDAGRQTRQR
jgi:glycerate 2-kinase